MWEGRVGSNYVGRGGWYLDRFDIWWMLFEVPSVDSMGFKDAVGETRDGAERVVSLLRQQYPLLG